MPEMIQVLFKRSRCFDIFHIADMLTEEGVTVTGETKSIFQVSTHTQDLRESLGQSDRIRSIAASAPIQNRAIFLR